MEEKGKGTVTDKNFVLHCAVQSGGHGKAARNVGVGEGVLTSNTT